MISKGALIPSTTLNRRGWKTYALTTFELSPGAIVATVMDNLEHAPGYITTKMVLPAPLIWRNTVRRKVDLPREPEALRLRYAEREIGVAGDRYQNGRRDYQLTLSERGD